MDVSIAKKRKFGGQANSARPQKVFKKNNFAKQIGAVASATAPEQKNIDIGVSTLTPAAANQWSALTFLNQIAQGTTANQRVGRRLTITKLTIRWKTLVTYGRLLVVYDHQSNGTAAAITDILTVNDINGVMNLINNDRFYVMHDEYINCSNNNSANQGGMAGTFTWDSRKKRNSPLQNQWSNATTGGIADCTTGAIYIMWAADTTTSVLSFLSRIRYTDQ